MQQSPLYGWVHWTAAQAVSGMAGDETGSKLRYNVMFYLEP
jgi:hypothetical protein